MYRTWTAQDAKELALSQKYFMLAQWVPCVMYYLRLGRDSKPQFPATISFTIRQGLPKYAHHVFWTLGWLKIGHLIRNARTDVKFRALATYIHGILTVVIFHLSEDKFKNKLHGVFAGLYMAEHWFLMRLLGHDSWYRTKFTQSFLGFCACLVALRRLEGHFQIPNEGECLIEDREAKIESLKPSAKALLYALSLAVMVLENGMFTAFTLGLSRDFVGESI